jgi:hypothetical protein
MGRKKENRKRIKIYMTTMCDRIISAPKTTIPIPCLHSDNKNQKQQKKNALHVALNEFPFQFPSHAHSAHLEPRKRAYLAQPRKKEFLAE